MLDGLSLIKIEEVLKNKLPGCELVSDLHLTHEDFIYLEEKFKEVFSRIDDGTLLRSSIYTFKASVTVLLVYEALYKYKKSFWENILGLLNIKRVNDLSIRECFADVFNNTIRKYGLKNFDGVGGYKNVTPIICHSGIPNHSLKSLFEITSQFMNAKESGIEDIIENIKYFIRYKVDKSIYRFITTNEDRAKELIYDLQILINEVENYDCINDDISNKFSYMDKRILNQYLDYKKNVEKSSAQRNKRRKYLVQPKLIFDNIKEVVCMDFPANFLKIGYDDKVEWIVTTDIKEQIIKCDIYEKDGENVSEEKRIVLEASSYYKVRLMYDGEDIGGWEYTGFTEEEPFLLFDSNNNLIKSNRVSDETIYIIMKKTCYIEEKSIYSSSFDIREKGWFGYKGIEVKFREKIQDISLVINEDKKIIIQYRNKNNIKLIGESEVFKEAIVESYIPMYSQQPPKIKIDNVIYLDSSFYIIIRSIKNNINLRIPIESSRQNDETIIDLANIYCFSENLYGEYDIRIISGKRLIKILPFKFVPRIKFNHFNIEDYPSERGFYREQKINVVCDKSIQITFDNLEGEVIEKENEREYYFNYVGVSHFINGNLEMQVNSNEYNFSIRKKCRSLCYDIINEGEDRLEFKKEPIKVFLKELQNNSKILALSFKDELNHNFKIQCILEDSKGNSLQVGNTITTNKKVKYISLNKFYDTIARSSLNWFCIKIRITNNNDKLLCEFIPCVIKEEVLISKISYEEIDKSNIVLSWSGEAVNVDNELVLKIYDLLKPWDGAKSININPTYLHSEGKRSRLYLNKEDYSLKNNSIYYFDIVENNDNFFEESENVDNILRFKKEGVYCLNVDYSIKKCNDIKILISYIIKTTKKEELEYLLSIIKELNVQGEINEDIIKGLYFLYANVKILLDLNTVEKKLRWKCIYILCKKYFDKCNIYELLDVLLKSDNYQNIRKFLDVIKLVNFDIDIKTSINKEVRDMLWQDDKERAFLIETRSGISSKSILIRNVFDLVGDDLEKKILGYSSECNYCKYKGNMGCVSKFIKRRCKKRKIILNEELIGSSKYYQLLFENYHTKLNQKALDNLQWINDEDDNGVVVFGGTYVDTLFKWVQNTNFEERKKIYDNISDSLSELKNLITKLEYNKEFIQIHEYLIKRKEGNKTTPNSLAYYCGVTVLLSSMIKYKRLEDVITPLEINMILKLLIKFRKNMNEIYLRDLIIIEFYLMQGEELYVYGSN